MHEGERSGTLTSKDEKRETVATTPADAAKANAARRVEAQVEATAKAASVKPRPSRPASSPQTPPATLTTEHVQAAPFAERTSGWLVGELRSTLKEGKQDVSAVRRRLRVTYAVIVIFSLAMFALGMALVGFPARAFYRGDIDELTFGALAGSGGVILALLLYFRPLDRLQALVADSTYVTLVKDSFQYQVALRLIALDTDDAASVERAATHVGEAAQASMELVYTQMQARRAAGFTAYTGS